MSSPPESRSLLAEFLDSFLQEKNIRWVLTAGLAILFGSSVMLVTSHWHEAGPVWKYLVFLGYTGIAFVAGQFVCPKLGLDRTATILLALVALLLPVTFVAWRWTWPGVDGGAMLRTISAALLISNTALTAFAGRAVFRRLLRRDQITFLASYVLLCVAGAVLPACPSWLLLPASVLLWGVFTIGSVKVNRHVFWLTEELKRPRVFDFFPIALLAAQFVGLLAFCVVPYVNVAWLGPICVLASLTILLTADTVAQVFEQRTGGIVWPWPATIAVPMATGLLVCLGGVLLASSGMAQAHDARPLVVAAALAALVMQRVARRTNHGSFVYATLLLATVAYNFLPSFAIETARLVITQSAQAVQEPRLPLAFYGLTYLPLIGGLLAMGAMAKKRGDTLFASPIERYVAFLSWCLLGLGTTHVKALAGVGLAMTAVFAVHERLFRSPGGMVGTIIAWLVGCAGVVPLANAVCSFAVPQVTHFLVFAGGAAVLFVVGVWRRRTGGNELPLYQLGSLTVSLAMAGVFPIFALAADGGAAALGLDLPITLTAGTDLLTWAAGLAIALLMFVHSLRWRNQAVSTAAVLFFQALQVLVVLQSGLAGEHLVAVATLSMTGQWLIARALKTRPTFLLSQVFERALRRALTVELSVALSLVWLPHYVLSACGATPWSGGALEWIAAAAIIGWAFDQAVQFRHYATALLGMLAILGLACTVFVSVAGPGNERWLPVVCGAMALAGVPVAEALLAYRRRHPHDEDQDRAAAARAIEQPLVGLLFAVFVGLAVWSIVACTTPSLVAAILAATGLAWFSARSRIPALRVGTIALISWQIVALPADFLTKAHNYVWNLSWVELQQVGFPVGLLAAIGFAAWALARRTKNNDVAAVVDLQRMGLGAVAIVTGLSALGVDDPTAWQISLSLLAPVVVAIAYLFGAWRDQIEIRVWNAMSLVGVILAYLFHWHLLRVDGQIAMFALLGTGVVAWSVGKALVGRGRLAIFSRPLVDAGYRLPALNLAVALFKQATVAEPSWLGPGTLALFLTAGFYFWRGVEERRPLAVLFAALVANVSLFLVWHELRITNPQCYMIPLGATVLLLTETLRREIPESVRDPLRYLGAIVVLVSPTFEMFDGSWLPFLTLMVVSVLVLLMAIGLRVRALMYAGAGFLAADLAGMVVRGCVDHPQLLWVAGLGIGTSVVVLGAVCELKRETLLARVRALSAVLETWN
jgi:hypothetical protein